MKTKKTITLATIVGALTVGALVTRVPQDLIRIHQYDKKIDVAIKRHDWLVNDIRSKYTSETPQSYIINEEAAISISAKLTTQQVIKWSLKKMTTAYNNPTLKWTHSKYISIQNQRRQKKVEKEEENKITYSI